MNRDLSYANSENYREWWESWRADDYSWAGLALQPWDVHINGVTVRLNMQAFWKSQQGGLIATSDGVKYTQFHFPFHEEVYVDGRLILRETEKFSWSKQRIAHMHEQLEAIVFENSRRLERSDFPLERQAEFGYSQSQVALLLDVIGPRNLSGIQMPNISQAVEAHNDVIFYKNYFSKFNIVGPAPELLNHHLVLDECFISEDIELSNVQFGSNFIIDTSKVMGSVNAYGVKFLDLCEFKIRNSTIGSFKVENSNIYSIEIKSKITNGYKCSFHDSRFRALADFRGCGIAFTPAFSNSMFDGGFLIDHETPGVTEDDYFKDFILGPTLEELKNRELPKGKIERRKDKSNAMFHIEWGARIIKNVMTAEKFDEMAHRYYRYELWARNNNPSTEWWTRGILTLYRLTSRYGYDLARPLIFVLLISFFTTFFYLFSYTYWLGWDLNFSLNALQFWGDAASFSIGRIAPIIPWGNASTLHNFDGSILKMGGLLGASIHFIAITQTLASTILFFFSALAARRRFKISD